MFSEYLALKFSNIPPCGIVKNNFRDCFLLASPASATVLCLTASLVMFHERFC